MTPPRRIRLAILGTRGIPARYGGFETFAEEIGVRLVERGVEVTVYCEAGEGVRPPTYRGVRLVYVPSNAAGPLTTVLFDVRSLWHARNGYDVVYMLGYGAAPFCVLPRRWGSRVWLNVDGVEWARAKWGRVARSYFKLMETASLLVPDRVIADAHGIRDHLLRRHRKVKPISVIPYGADILDVPPDPALLATWQLDPGSYYLVVCRLEPENHVREILEGFAASGSRRHLIVVGNQHVRGAYTAALRTFDNSRIRFIGTVYDQPRLQALRYHAFGYCHGHSVGGTNPSLLEALGAANAVIAHDNAFNREVARDAALYFGSARDLASCVDVLERSESYRTRMRSRAIEITRTDYNWDGVADRYLDLLKTDVAAFRPSACPR